MTERRVRRASFAKPTIIMKSRPNSPPRTAKTLQERPFTAKKRKSLAYVIAIMNMILHGIEAPNIIHTNTLTENLADIQEKDRFDVILANPPFGGKERRKFSRTFQFERAKPLFYFFSISSRCLRPGDAQG